MCFCAPINSSAAHTNLLSVQVSGELYTELSLKIYGFKAEMLHDVLAFI